MGQVEHYTSLQNWRRIRESGMIQPRSNPRPRDISNLPEGVDEIMTSERYVVGIPGSSREVWEEHELFQIVMGYKRREVRLDIPILDTDGVFFRERIYFSDEYLDEEFGPEFPRLIPRSLHLHIPEDVERIKEIYSRYFGSTLRLTDYGGQYKAPEIWLPQETPIDLIEAEVLESLNGN